MPILRKLADLFDVRPEERHLVASLMLVAFFMGLTFVFIQVPALALFVEAFGSEGLPPLYIAIAAISTAVSYIYLQIGTRVPFTTLLLLNFGFIATGTLIIRVVLGIADATWPLFFLPIWFEVVTTIGWIGFGTLQNRLFDVRQGRRLLGVVRMMVPGANILGGLTISTLSSLVDTRNLFFISAIACTVLIALLMALVLRDYGQRLHTSPAADRRTLAAESSTRAGMRRYVMTIFALIVVWWIAFYFIDNIFFDLLEERFPTSQQIAAFLGVFFGMVQGSLLLLGNLFTSRIIQRIGIRASVLVMPVIITVCVIGLIMADAAGAALTTVFALGAAAKLANGAIGFSVDTNARTLFYQPLPPETRSRVQTIGQGIVEPLAIGFVGAVLLVLTGVLDMGAVQLGMIFLGIAALWIVTAVVALNAYPQALKQAIAKRRLGEGSFNFADKASIQMLRSELDSRYPEAVIYAMSILRDVDTDYLKSRLPLLLDHPAPEVQQEALAHIEALHVTEAADRVQQQISDSVPAPVRQAALSTLAALGGEHGLSAVAAYLDHPDAAIQQGAVAGLLRHGGPQERALVLERLQTLSHSADAAERLIVAETLQAVADETLHDILAPLLTDANHDVRRMALLAAGKMRHPALWDDVLRALEVPGLRTQAAQALVYGGDDAVPVIVRAFDQSRRRDVQVRLARAVGRIRSEAALSFLRGRLNYPDEEVRTQILASLSAGAYHADEATRGRIEQQIRQEAMLLGQSLSIYADLGDGEAVSLLRLSLQNDMDQTRDRIFYLLSFLYDTRAMLQARDALAHGTAQQQAYALEVIDNVLPRPMRAYLLPLLESTPIEQRIHQAGKVLDLPKRYSRNAHLMHLVRMDPDDQNPWMTLYALYAVSQLQDARYAEIVAQVARQSDGLIRETALWALAQLDPAAHRQLVDFLGFPGQQFDRHSAQNGEQPMYSTIEKLVILKTISIFEETPSDVLVDIANLMDAVEVKAGETVINKGDLGQSLYVIVTGKMRVHDGDVTLNTLRDRDVFGELALLDPEPRAASVTAMEDTTLLRLDQEPFYELIADRGEVARGIMKVLVRTIRASARDLTASQQRQP